MADIILPKLTGDVDNDVWAVQATEVLQQAIDDIGGNASLMTDDEGRMTVEDEAGDTVVLGYSRQYLDIAFANSATPTTDFVKRLEDLTPPTADTTTFFQGFRNTDTATESTNPADFSWVQRRITGGTLGGGQFTSPGFTNMDQTNAFHINSWYLLPTGVINGIRGSYLYFQLNNAFPSTNPETALVVPTQAQFSYENSMGLTITFQSEALFAGPGAQFLIAEIPADQVDAMEAEGADIRLNGMFPDELVDNSTPANPLADFTTVGPLYLVSDSAVTQYRATGARNIIWMYTDAPQDNYEIHMGGVIDLDDISSSIAGIPGIPGEDGAPGLSAYQLAVEEGFTGTLAEWLASINGDPGADGVSTSVIYQAAGMVPMRPGDSAATPALWEDTPPTLMDGEFIWISVGTRQNRMSNYVWSDPFQFSPTNVDIMPMDGNTGSIITVFHPDGSEPTRVTITSGADGRSPTATEVPGGVEITDADGNTAIIRDGNNGMDGDGLEVIYTNQTSLPQTPAPSPDAPTGPDGVVWSFTQTVPAAGQRTYVSIGVRRNNTGNYTWSQPAQLTGLDGIRGDKGDTGDQGPEGDPGAPPDVFRSIWLYQNAASQPREPSGTQGYNRSTGMAANTGSWRTTASLPSAGQVIWLARLDIIQREGMGNFNALVNWVVSQASGFDGDAGARGPTGPGGQPGTPGPRFVQATLYTNPPVTVQPQAPQAIFNWTGANPGFASITGGWRTDPPTQRVSSTDRVYSSTVLFIDTTGTASSTSAIGSAPVQATNFEGVVTFSNAEGRFGLVGGNFTTINGDQIRTETITASKVKGRSLEGAGLRIGTLSSASSGARTEISDTRIRVYDESGTLRVTIGDLR